MLDEPSLGLAPRVVAAILEVLARSTAAGVAVFLVEQNVRAALGLAHRAYVLEPAAWSGRAAAPTLLARPARASGLSRPARRSSQ